MSSPLTLPLKSPAIKRRPPARNGLRVIKRLLRQPLTLVAMAWILVVIIAAIFAPVLAPYDPTDNDFVSILQGPSAEHWLGTDENGRDVLSRMLYGAQIALLVGTGSVLVAMAIGVPLGLLLGFRGAWWDRLGTRVIDIFDALPGIVIAFAVIAILDRGLGSIMLAIGIMFSMSFARMARAITLAERSKLYIDAARVSGLRESAIVFKQVLPNLAGPLIVQAAILTGAAIIIESALSFLGIGLSSSIPSWGGLLGVAAGVQAVQPFLAFPPGIAIILTVLAFNLVGDGLNEAITGRRRTRRVTRKVRKEREAAEAQAREETPAWAGPTDPENVLETRSVSVELEEPSGDIPLIRDVTLTVRRGEVVGVLGESGSGKSMFTRAVLGLLPAGTHLGAGEVILDGENIAHRDEKQLRGIRGRKVAAVFQDPMAALSPVHTIGTQVVETLRAHFPMSKAEARERAAALLDRVGVRDAESRLDDYPHQFSGGMAQRVGIAIALAAEPQLLIADEATSALDVTTQAQVIDLLLELKDEMNMAILLITHDLGVVAESCDRVAVMYAGEIVEVAEVQNLFHHPQHPYTAALLAANPTKEGEDRKLAVIPGQVPLAGQWPNGCHFATRCAFARPECTGAPVEFINGVRCVRADSLVLEEVAK
ncbi:dipeptide/oligopeptide/nickel ABC transporter permease/ATP-binding protein [Microbacterium sp. LRZ72]|uniref:dipeptide/oligopeptide/nickel ABC transporter permease/ATP-binding protein n=1 Tax=Microbacterium sp. LRZ72 TaxID=2942481 RepID=UPI0029A16B24|nr:dipeptide/oligopeptide/nickel ABC transporter permease/ATP-binding protein [Microbacterium sp. LRZ72]MDX2377523.1 dipeptide/oligopeptide/nickel ABC transporter permease/ATP-binding protein [Microbacterium sp. LRZ72]